MNSTMIYQLAFLNVFNIREEIGVCKHNNTFKMTLNPEKEQLLKKICFIIKIKQMINIYLISLQQFIAHKC